MNTHLEKTFDLVLERIKSPFMFSTLLSWPFINYQIFFVLFSSETFTQKFNYIESTLYPDFWAKLIHWGIIPISVGLFYTLVYPLIDTELSVLSQYLVNRRERKLLKETRKLPIDADLQAKFFSEYDERIEKIKSDHQITWTRLQDENAINKTESTELRSRLQILARALLQQATGLDYGKMTMVLDTHSTYGQSDNTIKEVMAPFKQDKPLLNNLRLFFEKANNELDKNPQHEQGKIIKSLDWLIEGTDMDAYYAKGLLEVLIALNIVGEGPSQQSLNLQHIVANPYANRLQEFLKLES